MLFGWTVVVSFRRGDAYIVYMCWVGERVCATARQFHAIVYGLRLHAIRRVAMF